MDNRRNKYNNYPPHPNNNQRYQHQYPHENRPAYYPQRHDVYPQRSHYNDDHRGREPKPRDERWQRHDRSYERDRYDRRDDYSRYSRGDRHRPPPMDRGRYEPRENQRSPRKLDLDLGAEPVSEEEEEEGEARDDDEEGQISDEPMPDVTPPPAQTPSSSSRPAEHLASRSDCLDKPRHGHGVVHQPRDYKIIVDPAIHKNQGTQKVYRFAGLMPGTKTSIDVIDPRSRWKVWMKREPVDLEVPKFKVDSNYVGTPLPKEVSFTNLNDNISQTFLEDMCRQFGTIDDCKIFHHPKTRRHLGVGMVLFASTKSARACVDKLNNTSKMGKVMTVFLDTLGKARQALLDDLATSDRPRFEAPVQGIIPERRTSTFEYEDMSAHCKTRYFGREPPKEEKKDKEKDKPKERDRENRRSSTCDEKEDDDRPPLPRSHDTSYDSGSNFTPSTPASQSLSATASLPPTPHSFGSGNETSIPFPVAPTTPAMPGFSGFRNRFNQPFQPGFEMKNQPKRFGHVHAPIIPQQPPGVLFPPSPLTHREFGYQHNLASPLTLPPRTVQTPTEDEEDPDAKKRRRRREAKERKKKERRAQRAELEQETSAINEDQPSQSSSPKLEDTDKSTDISNKEDDTSAQTTELDDSRLASDEDNKESTTEPEWDVEILNSTADEEGTLNAEGISLNETNEEEPSFMESSYVEEDPAFSLPTKSSLDSRIEMFLKQQDEDHHPPVLQPPALAPAQAPVDMYVAPMDADMPPMDVEVMMGDLDTGEEVVGDGSMYTEDSNMAEQQNHDDDRMSLSSLSSNDENMTISHQPYSQPLNPLMPGFSIMTSPQKQPLMPMGKGPSLEAELANCFDPNDVTFMNILTEIVDQMRLVMKKDLSKRVVELWGFKKFDSWWDEEEQKEKKLMNGEKEPQKPEAPVIKQDTTASLQMLFERQSVWAGDGLGVGGFLGMKRSLPHMPSFRRFRRFRPPSPPKDDEDEDESADEEKEEKAEKKKLTKDKKETTKRKPVWTSDSSAAESSGDSSSEAEEDEEDEEAKSSSSSSSESEDEEVAESSSTSSSSSSSGSESEEEEIDVESEPTELSKDLSTSIEELKLSKKREKSEEREIVQKVMDSTIDSMPEVEELSRKVPPKRGRKKKEIRPPTPEIKASEEEEKPMRTLYSEHNYSSRDREPERHEPKPVLDSQIAADDKPMEEVVPLHLMDHIYFMPLSRLTPAAPPKPDVGSVAQRIMNEMAASASANKTGPKETFGRRPYQRKPKLADITTEFRSKGNRELAAILEDLPTEVVVKPTYRKRLHQDEIDIMYQMFVNGIDEEDIEYLKTCYEDMLQEETTQESEYLYWLNDVHWVDHPFTQIPNPVQQPLQRKKRKIEESGPTKVHSTGSSRTEGYYPISVKDKAEYLWIVKRMLEAEEKAKQEERDKMDSQKVSKQQLSREARSNQRRLLTSYSDVIENVEKSDLLKFNHLKFRKKQIKFAKSMIHDWGLFALEPIAAEEMVIEYVGQSIRPPVADLREKQYQRIGIGSSYLFRVDSETIIDATKVGNLARFINHCCNPNCYAKVITVDSLKKIVIYSRRDIEVNEEITYDYKFPLEDEKIPCLCGAVGCRGYLN